MLLPSDALQSYLLGRVDQTEDSARPSLDTQYCAGITPKFVCLEDVKFRRHSRRNSNSICDSLTWTVI